MGPAAGIIMGVPLTHLSGTPKDALKNLQRKKVCGTFFTVAFLTA